MWIAIAAAALAGGQLTGTCGVTDRFEVLAVEPKGGLVAFKHVYQPPPSETGVRCRYAGMDDLPDSAVVLGVYDLGAGKTIGSWTVYAEAQEPDQCTPHAESTRALAAAKARFAELGLDLDARPEPVVIAPGQDAVKVPASGGPATVRLQSGKDPDPENAGYTLWAEASVGGSRYRTTTMDPNYGSAVVRFVAAYPIGSDVLLVEATSEGSMGMGDTCYRFARIGAR